MPRMSDVKSIRDKSNSLRLLIITCLLAGCGTMDRGDSDNIVYRGVDRSDEPLQQCRRGMFGCFGLDPLVFPFVIASYPIDFAVDTLLLPIDVTRYTLMKRRYLAEHPFITLQLYSIDFTNDTDNISYTLGSAFYPYQFNVDGRNYPAVSTIMIDDKKSWLMHRYQNKKGDQSAELSEIIFPDPSKPYRNKPKLSLQWQESYTDANSSVKPQKYSLSYGYSADLPDYSADSRVVSVAFLPCHQLQIDFFNDERAMRENIEAVTYQAQHLTQLAAKNQCPPLQNGVKLRSDSRANRR
jgi:uncharacterized protein YceK